MTDKQPTLNQTNKRKLIQVTGFEELAKQTALYPKEAPLAVKTNRNSLLIGLPKEVSLQENRIALTPEAVAILVRNGHNVIVEQGAGEKAKFSDTEYSEAGAQIAQSPKEVYEANLILKVEPLVEEEFDHVQSGSTVISALNLPAHDRAYFEKINNKNLTCFRLRIH